MKNNIPQLGKVINKIQNPYNLHVLKMSTLNLFTKPKETNNKINNIINKKHVDSPHDELNTDHHDGKIIQKYLNNAKRYVKDHKITPAQFTNDIKKRYQNQYYLNTEHSISTAKTTSKRLQNKVPANLPIKAHQAKISQNELNHKYGYTFKANSVKGFSPHLNKLLENRNMMLISHEAKLAEQKENYYIKVMRDETPESNNDEEAEYGKSVTPTKWFPNMDEAKEYAKGINSSYDDLYNAQIDFKKHHPYNPSAESSKDLQIERKNKKAFNKSMKQTYKNTKKMSKKLDKKFNHPSKEYKHTIKEYNKQIQNELIKAGYLKPTIKEQKILKNVVGLKHSVHDKRYQTTGHQPKVSKEHKQNKSKQLTKQQEIKYEKNQGRQI